MEEILDFFEIEAERYHSIYRWLEDGRKMEFRSIFSVHSITTGAKVFIRDKIVEDGLYRLRDYEERIEIKRGEVSHKFYIEKYKQKGGGVLEVDGSRITGIGAGSRVWFEGEKAPDGVYRRGWLKAMIVKDGVIERLFYSL